MTELFYTILNMSISASILILAVLLLRLLFRKAPKWISVLLWGLVAVRLICPFALETPFSLMPKTEWITEEPAYNEEYQYFDSVPPDRITVDSEMIGNDVNVHYYSVPVEPHIEINRGVNPVFVLNCIWLAGIAAMLVYMLVSYICVYRRIRGAEQFKDNIYTSESVSSPFVFGIIRPRIYLPENMDAISMSYVIAHEEAHLRRLDHLWKPIGFLLLAVHWFNPLIWLGYILLCRDIEMACDERVVRSMNEEERVDYSEALLECSVSRKLITACPLAFGEVGAKQRIKSVLNYTKPAFWIVVVSVIACVAAATFFLTNPSAQRDYICNIVDESFRTGAIESTLTEPFIEDEVRDELLFDVVRANFKSFKEPISLEIQNTTYMLYNGKDTAVYLIKANDSEDFTNICMAYIQPRGNKEPLGQVKLEGENAESLKTISSNISAEKLSYATLKQHQEEIWAYKTTAVNDDVDETFRKWGERIAAAGVDEAQNCVVVYVYDFDEGDIGRFKKALGHLSYVLIQKDDVIEMIPDEKKQLTLEDVIALSAKGQDLTWEDFESFNFKETGSGLYIRLYEIDETFSVWIGGGAPIDSPMYIYLSANDLDTRIDIRDGGVEEFISRHGKLFDHPQSYYIDIAWPAALSTAESENIRLDKDRFVNIRHGYEGQTIWVQFPGITDGGWDDRSVEVTLVRGENGEYSVMAEEIYIISQQEIQKNLVISQIQNNIRYLEEEIAANPGKYAADIPRDSNAYENIFRYDDALVLECIFSEFLAGSQTDLHGFVLQKIMTDILNENELIAYDAENGQDYFDHWLASARSVAEQHDPVWLEVNVPSIALVLKMTGDISSETYVEQPEVDPDPVDTAISRALNQHYRDDKPTGLLHGISYVLLANETVSGTPRFEQTNHIEKEIY